LCKDPQACIEIPDNITSIKESDPKAALNLRLKTREQFENLMNKGFVVVGFEHDPKNQVGRYWLARP
jgi:predicted GNAT superfamily acetyltransferase